MKTRRLTFVRDNRFIGVLMEAVDSMLEDFLREGPVKCTIVDRADDGVIVDFTYADGYDAWPDSQRLAALMGSREISAVG